MTTLLVSARGENDSKMVGALSAISDANEGNEMTWPPSREAIYTFLPLFHADRVALNNTSFIGISSSLSTLYNILQSYAFRRMHQRHRRSPPRCRLFYICYASTSDVILYQL